MLGRRYPKVLCPTFSTRVNAHTHNVTDAILNPYSRPDLQEKPASSGQNDNISLGSLD